MWLRYTIDTKKNSLSVFTYIPAIPVAETSWRDCRFALTGRVIRHEPLGVHDCNCLQMCIFAVCICTSTKQPEDLDKSYFMLSGIDEHCWLQVVDTSVTMVAERNRGIPVPDYE